MKKILVLSLAGLMLATGAGARRNVILIVPDGTSVSLWSTVRAMTVGSGGDLNIDTMPLAGLCRTYSANSMITDSAAAGTALACGARTNNGIIGMDRSTVRADSLTGRPLKSVMVRAREKGFSTGIVTTATVQHATPAVFYSNRADRDWYELIANDLVDSGIDVIMGGGRQYMLPAGTLDQEQAPSKRTDSRNLVAEMREKGYIYVYDRKGLMELDTDETERVLGLFNPGHMQYEFDRSTDTLGEPGIWEMTARALDILSRNKKGFVLLVEAGRIDHAAHDHDTDRFLWEGVACDKAIGVALDFARENKNTLVLVVPDHGTGGPHFAGALIDSLPADPYEKGGFVSYTLNENGFPVAAKGSPVALQWIDWGGHTGEDVTWFAEGVDADRIPSRMENIDVFAIMVKHLELAKKVRRLEDIVDF